MPTENPTIVVWRVEDIYYAFNLWFEHKKNYKIFQNKQNESVQSLSLINQVVTYKKEANYRFFQK
jgi:hypothetical protein